MVSEDTIISVNNLKKNYKNATVLDNVNFNVKKGTIFSLLGSNGAGKTTTIKILTTLIHPDEGDIRIYNYDVSNEPAKVRDLISLTGQYATVDETLTGFENLVMIGKLNHLSKPKERANELLEYFNLTKAAHRFVSTYSGGMRRKLDIAMSLVSQPKIIFLDEPTTGLDPQSRHSMWNIIKELKKSGVTIFLTTQYLEEAEQLADKIAILNKGSIIVEGTSMELKNMLPQGIVEFVFPNLNSLEQAISSITTYKCSPVYEQNKLIIYTDGSANALGELFNRLTSNKITMQEFTQKLPSLEDVFLTLIGEKEGLQNE